MGKDKFNFLASILLKVNDFDYVFDHHSLQHVNQPICFKPTDIYIYTWLYMNTNTKQYK
jgi:hypothetical protein